jgi:SLOG family YspA-like protein
VSDLPTERDWLEGLLPGANQPRLIAVCGGRDFTDRQLIRKVLAEYLPPAGFDEPQIIHGDARGADRLAGQEASDLGFWVEGVPADWKRNGKAAGPIRNRQMLDRKPDLVIAFPGGKGTAHMVGEAKKRGIEVREVKS